MDAFRQSRGDFGQPCLDAGDDGLSIGAAQAKHQALYSFTLTVLGNRAVAGEAAQSHSGDIGDTHDVAVGGLQNNGVYVVDRSNCTFGPHQQSLFAISQATAAIIAIVGFEHCLQILQGQATGRQILRIGHHFKGSYFAAQTVDVGDAGNGA